MDILTILSLSVHEQKMSFQLFVCSLFQQSVEFLAYKSLPPCLSLFLSILFFMMLL